MKRLWLVCVVLVSIVASVGAQEVTLDERGYFAYVPSSYTGEALPLVITLHGYGDAGDSFARTTDWVNTAEEYGFVVAFLNGYMHQWNDGRPGDHNEDDTAAILDLIEALSQEIILNHQRIYLVGFSNGASMTFRAACEAPGTFAGIAAVNGPMVTTQTCSYHAQTSVMVIHGTSDNIVPFDGGKGLYSAPQTVTYWADLDQCTDEDVPAFDPDFTSITLQFYDECAGGHLVMLYAIRGLGHIWPGANQHITNRPLPRQLDANFLIWGFFEIAYQSQQAAQSQQQISQSSPE